MTRVNPKWAAKQLARFLNDQCVSSVVADEFSIAVWAKPGHKRIPGNWYGILVETREDRRSNNFLFN